MTAPSWVVLRLSLIFVGVLLLLAVAGALVFTSISNSHKKEIIALQNEVAKRDVTIEVQKNVYAKLAIQTDMMGRFLGMADEQNQALAKEIKDRKAEILTAQTLVIKWKKAYEALVVATETEVTTPEGVVRTKIEFKKDFGYLIAEGHTLTNPPEALVRVKQGRPFRLSVIMTQEPDKSWRGYATSNEDNFSIEAEVFAVDPTMLEPKWYEKIGLHADLAAGSGVLVGIGASYKIGKFTVGPSVWGAMNWDIQPKGYVGVSMGFNPFQRN